MGPKRVSPHVRKVLQHPVNFPISWHVQDILQIFARLAFYLGFIPDCLHTLCAHLLDANSQQFPAILGPYKYPDLKLHLIIPKSPHQLRTSSSLRAYSQLASIHLLQTRQIFFPPSAGSSPAWPNSMYSLSSWCLSAWAWSKRVCRLWVTQFFSRAFWSLLWFTILVLSNAGMAMA